MVKIYEATDMLRAPDGHEVPKVRTVSILMENPGKQLSCTCRAGSVDWCRHKLMAIKKNLDGPYMMQCVDGLTGEFSFDIPISLKHDITFSVDLRRTSGVMVPEQMTEGDLFLAIPTELLEFPPFASRLVGVRGRFGSLSYGEGRSVVRDLLRSAMDQAFIEAKIFPEIDGKACRGPLHSLIEQEEWERLRLQKDLEGMWVWKYHMLIHSGLCKSCWESSEKALREYKAEMERETMKEILAHDRATATPW